jgi:outer membrane protein assembly factor BamA
MLLVGLASLSLCMHAQRVRVDSVIVEGVKKTKPAVVTRQMTFQEGDSINLDDWEAILKENKSNIYNLGIFTSVEIVQEIGPGVVNVRVRVQERWYVWPTPYIALKERTINEWLKDKDLDRLVYGMGVEWYNLTGWNDKLYFYAQGGYQQMFIAQYYRPFLFPKPKIDGSCAFTYINDKEIGCGTQNGYLQLLRLKAQRMRQSYTGQLFFNKRLSPREQIQLTAAYQYFKINDSIHVSEAIDSGLHCNTRYLPVTQNTVHYPSLGLSYVNDQRDIRSFPLSGYKVGLGLRHFGLPGLSAVNFAKLSLSFSHHIPLGKRWNFAYGSQQFMLLGKDVPFFDKYFIGFGSFLRGYEPYVIDGSFVNLTKAEWKFGILPYRFMHLKWIPFQKFRDFPMGLYLSAYCDAGYVHDWTSNNQDGFLKDKLLLGYGAGVNFITIYDFLLRVEYSRNKLGGSGIYFSTLVSIQ